jgi:hypothetical protein
MSIRQQITKAITERRSKIEINLHGTPVILPLPTLDRECVAGYNVRKKDRRIAKRAEELADEQMAILAQC